MKLIILTLCVAGALARPDVSHLPQRKDESQAMIVHQELDVSPDGSYSWAYETDSGIVLKEQGAIQNPQADNPALKVVGDVQYQSPGGENILLTYVADENGYQPQGSHLPTSPPIPEAILRSLEYNRAHPPPPEKP